ncbi:hypothetical protein ACGFNP_01940 [Nonomuraea sp. NPDC049269]|uniref:hypothetical protein n=1 Tax=Nonomuraea sp. NPDC049269 TaxID=3364349 RepID=UPI00371864DC
MSASLYCHQVLVNRSPSGSRVMPLRMTDWPRETVRFTTAEWVDWFNRQRLHTAIGDVPPTEHEAVYYAQHRPQPAAGVNP